MVQEDLQITNYVRRVGNDPVYDPQTKPHTFYMTPFHFTFVFQSNFTVLSSITHDIVYSKNFGGAMATAVYDPMLRYLVIVNRNKLEKHCDEISFC